MSLTQYNSSSTTAVVPLLPQEIETEEQEEAAIKAGCDLLQGFYYYKPMSVAMLERLFEKEKQDG